jgi:hypothetical protein
MDIDNQTLDLKVVQLDRGREAKGYRFQTAAEMSATPVRKDWLIKGVFARGESSAWVAPPGGMKSALLAEASVCVAYGDDWHGHRNKGAMGVVYFALERADLVRRRILAHVARLGRRPPPIVVVGDMIDPRNAKRIAATIQEAENALEAEIGLAVFDTFAKLIAAAGGNENDAKDQGMVFANLQRVKNVTGVHVAIIGHTGKDVSRGMRGSNAALGDVDVMVEVAGDIVRTATVTKANDAPEGPLFSFKSDVHEFGTDEDGDAISVNIVSNEPVDVASPAIRTTKWTKGLKLVHDAIAEAILQAGVDHRIAGDGPVIKAAPVSVARTIHNQRYVSNGDGDRTEAERKAWGRNFKQARELDLVSGELSSGEELIWLVTS